MRDAYLIGRGLWAPGFGDLFAWLEGHEDPSVTVPACTFVGSRLLRATSILTRALCEVAWQATREAGFDPKSTPTVFGSMHGEIQTAIDLLDMLRDENVMSPARFKNSVHNTAAGIHSIATGNRSFTTAVAAGPSTLAMCLLEAMALLGTDEETVVVAVGEERLPELLRPMLGDFAPLGVGLALTRTPPEGGRALARLSGLRREPGMQGAALAPRFEGNPTAPGLALLERLARGDLGTCALEIDGGEGWCVELCAP